MSVNDGYTDRTELTLTEIAAQARLPLSTTHRIMQALVRGGHLERTGELYRVGPRLAAVAPPPRVSAEEVAPHLYALATRLRLTVSLGIMEQGVALTVVSARPTVKHGQCQIPAVREPLHGTPIGK